MKHYKSVGISAPQIGVPLRIMMVEIPDFFVEHFGTEVCKTREIFTTPFKVNLFKVLYEGITSIVHSIISGIC